MPNTGSGATLNLSTGVSDLPAASINGTVRAVVPDGAGGWYIGGEFTEVQGQSRPYLAHLLADGRLDPTWAPAANGWVYALGFDGTTVYAGGTFTLIDGLPRNRLGSIDASSGTVTPWNPDADTTVTLTRDTWNRLIARQTTLQKEILGGGIEVEGSVIGLVQFFAMLDEQNPSFGIVLP